jgi:PAS domain S-box-containing protein
MNAPVAARDPQELQRSFDAFTRISLELEQAYDRLRAQAAKVDLALADTNRRLSAKVAELDAVLSSLGGAVVVTDRDGRVTLANRRFGELCGAAPSELVGQRKAELADERGRPLCEPESALADGDATLALPCRPLRLQGEARIVRSTRTAVVDGDGRAIGEVEVLNDETELEALRDESRRRETLTALGEMAAGIAHEIRNPLTAIEGFAGLLRESLGDGDEQAVHHARRIGLAVRQANSIITNLLCIARPERFRPLRARLAPLLSGLRASLAEGAELGSVDVRPPDPADLAAACDAALIERVLVNLVDNARRATGPRGHVVVRAEAGDGEVVLHVDDDGPGIAPELRARLFRPFVTGRADGTGLGLFLVHRIVELHRGSVVVADRDGGGTRFTVRLPDLPARVAAAGRVPALPPPGEIEA